MYTNWEDIFELKEVNQYQYGGFMRIGGDPESGSDPTVYKIVRKGTGEFIDNYAPMTRYTAEYYANKAFQDLENEVEFILTD